MRLVVWHKILIASGLAAAVLFAAWSAMRYARGGSSSALIFAGGSLVVAGVLAAYLRAVSRKLARVDEETRQLR